jgi:predicted nucleic-acid-binding protein
VRSLDTNVLARFFVDDADDAQAAKQRPAAIAALSERAFVSVTVLMEFEWVMRGFYALPLRDMVSVFRALAGIEHISIEDRAAVMAALEASRRGSPLPMPCMWRAVRARRRLRPSISGWPNGQKAWP